MPSNALTFEQVTVAGTAIGFTAAKITTSGVNSAFVTVETAQVRFTVDGTTPTSTVGHLLNPGDTLTVQQGDLSKIKFIRTGGVSAVISVSYGSDLMGESF